MLKKIFSFDALGSTFHISFLDISSTTSSSINFSECLLKCREECERFEKQYSRFKDVNTLSIINQGIGESQAVDEEIFYLCSKANEYARNTHGAFTLYTKEILEQWGYDSAYSFKERTISKNHTELKGQISKPIEIDVKQQEIRVFAPIEFGGLGKGYMLDKLKEICLDYYPNIIINAGGDLYAQNEKNSVEINLEHPQDISKIIGTITINNKSLASSSSNRRSWSNKHHIVHPKNLEPANDMLATYVLCDLGIDADSYATALFVLGFEEAKKIVQELQGVECLLISKEFELWNTKGFKYKQH